MWVDLVAGIRAVAVGRLARAFFALPDGALRRIFGEPPEVAAGLRPDAWAICRVADLIERPAEAPDPASMRAQTEFLAHAVADRSPLPVEVEDLDLGEGDRSLPARLYRPSDAIGDGPLLVWFHGGGWVVGSLESHDYSCRRLAHNTGSRVLAVDYRLAPEHPFPAAPDDALHAWHSVLKAPARFGADPGLIAVGGDSAGGALAAVLCQDLRAEGSAQPRFQLLAYPVTEIGSTRPSTRDFATGFYLTDRRMRWYSDRYAPGPAADDPRASPLKAADLSGLAPAYVITSLADPLRDEGEAYAARLSDSGVETRLDRFPLVHAWFNQTLSRSAIRAHELMAAQVRVSFGSASRSRART